MFSISRFQQLMKGLPRDTFERLAEARRANKYSKGFDRWKHLLTMVYGQCAGAGSLRQIEAGFNSHARHHYHLGGGLVKRSTLSDANNKYSGELFADVARLLMHKVHRKLRKESEELLYLLDSTAITLKGRGFDEWTRDTRTRNIQGLKLHLLYAAHQQVPTRYKITSANVNDITSALDMPIEERGLYVFDKGYCDYNWWHHIHKQGARFVTRFKYNASLVVEEQRVIPEDAQGVVLEDQCVRFKNKHPGGQRYNHYQTTLRRIVVAREDKDKPLILATNDLSSSALTIAMRYRSRWQIELFFKWIKQHLNIKRFLGRSENAVRIQILTALISYLLLALHRNQYGLRQSMWECLMLMRATLFQRPQTEEMLDHRRRYKSQYPQNQLELFA